MLQTLITFPESVTLSFAFVLQMQPHWWSQNANIILFVMWLPLIPSRSLGAFVIGLFLLILSVLNSLALFQGSSRAFLFSLQLHLSPFSNPMLKSCQDFLCPVGFFGWLSHLLKKRCCPKTSSFAKPQVFLLLGTQIQSPILLPSYIILTLRWISLCFLLDWRNLSCWSVKSQHNFSDILPHIYVSYIYKIY